VGSVFGHCSVTVGSLWGQCLVTVRSLICHCWVTIGLVFAVGEQVFFSFLLPQALAATATTLFVSIERRHLMVCNTYTTYRMRVLYFNAEVQ